MRQGSIKFSCRMKVLALAIACHIATVRMAAAGYPTVVLTDKRLLAETGQNSVFGLADDEGSHLEFLSLWGDILKRARRLNIRHDYISGTVSLKYDSSDDLQLRRFSFDSDMLSGDPVDNIRHLASVMEESGLVVAGAFAVKSSSTAAITHGAIYYLTQGQTVPDAEMRLRYLSYPDPDVRIGRSLLEKAGVRVVLRQGSGAIFYIGKRLGIYVIKSASPTELTAKTLQYGSLLKAKNEIYIGLETDIVDDAAGTSWYINKVFSYLNSSARKQGD